MMELLNSLGEFLTKFGGWGAFLILAYAFRAYYLDQQKKEDRQEKKDAATFTLVVKMTADMSTVLGQYTVETRVLADNLEQMQELLAPATKQDSRKLLSASGYDRPQKKAAAAKQPSGDTEGGDPT